MMDLLPFDLTEILRVELERDKRQPDGLLHPSTHLTGSLRHTQLDLAGAPKIASELVSDIRLKTGTFWHEYIDHMLKRNGVPYMSEVDLTPWLPAGWSGTADHLVWHPEYEAFILWDLKTIKGEGIRWKEREGAAKEHIWQASAYWYAARDAGFPLVNRLGIYYLPMNDTGDRNEIVVPMLAEVVPVPEFDLKLKMNHIKKRVDEYLDSLREQPERPFYLTDALEPEQPRVQKVYWSSKAKAFEVKLVPHWSTDYCPYPNELCACSEQGTTKIGEYQLLFHDPHPYEYVPREGYEDVEPEIEPDPQEVNRRRKELLDGNNRTQ